MASPCLTIGATLRAGSFNPYFPVGEAQDALCGPRVVTLCPSITSDAWQPIMLMTGKPRSPTISVITPLYNSAGSIEATLASLCAQTYDDWEAILVNDGSTDDTAEKVKLFLGDSRFSYIEQVNGGIAAARNTGIKAASGEWVCLLDHDDRWLPTKLETQLEFANEHGCDIVCTDAVAVQKSSRKLYSQFYEKEFIRNLERINTDPDADVFGLLIRHDFLCASSVM